MGLDATIYVSGEGVSDERLAELGANYSRTQYTDEKWITYDTSHRYFDASYPRGSWPAIREQILEVRAAFPDRPVFYASDSWWYGEVAPWTDEDMDRTDREWDAWCATGLTYSDLLRAAIDALREGEK